VKVLKQDTVTALSTAALTDLVTVMGTDMVLSMVGSAALEDTAELRKMHKATKETLQAETLEAETAEVVSNDRYNKTSTSYT
jgi:hypothetical protein